MLGISKDDPNNAHETAVGSNAKIGIIDLDTLRALTRWLTHFNDRSVKESATCDGPQALTGLPPAHSECSSNQCDSLADGIGFAGNSSTFTGVESGAQPGHAAATAKCIVANCSQGGSSKQQRGGRS